MRTHLILFLTVIYSCNSDPVWSKFESSDSNFDSKYSFEVDQKNMIYLDSVTGPISYNIQYILRDSSEILALWNKNDNSIMYYELNSFNPSLKQFFLRSGPNANYSSNFYYLNQDSIFSTDAIKFIYLTNQGSKIENTYPISDNTQFARPPSPYVWTGSPFFLKDNKLFFQCYMGGVFDRPTMAFVNLESKQISYFGEYPWFYLKAYWRGGFEYMTHTFNADQNLLVMSFAADHYLRTIDINKLEVIDSAFAGSDKLSNIKAPRLKMSDSGSELDDQKFLTQSSYGRLLYDEYRKVYYRFAFEGINDSDLTSDSNDRATIKPSMIIILNENFKKIGEYSLNRFKYDLNMTFVSRDGLNIRLKAPENEDIIMFDILKLIAL